MGGAYPSGEKVSDLEGRGGDYKDKYQNTRGKNGAVRTKPRPTGSTNHVKSREAQQLPSLGVTLDKLRTTVVQLR